MAAAESPPKTSALARIPLSQRAGFVAGVLAVQGAGYAVQEIEGGNPFVYNQLAQRYLDAFEVPCRWRVGYVRLPLPEVFGENDVIPGVWLEAAGTDKEARSDGGRWKIVDYTPLTGPCNTRKSLVVFDVQRRLYDDESVSASAAGAHRNGSWPASYYSRLQPSMHVLEDAYIPTRDQLLTQVERLNERPYAHLTDALPESGLEELDQNVRRAVEDFHRCLESGPKRDAGGGILTLSPGGGQDTHEGTKQLSQ